MAMVLRLAFTHVLLAMRMPDPMRAYGHRFITRTQGRALATIASTGMAMGVCRMERRWKLRCGRVDQADIDRYPDF